MSEQEWRFCPHGYTRSQHCETCCDEIGDAERDMHFDWPERDEPPMTVSEEFWRGEYANDWGGS